MPVAYLAIGANIDSETNIRRGLALLTQRVCVMAVSTFYRTPALARPDDPPFINGVAEIETALPPRELKVVLRDIEAACNRTRTADSLAPRTLDIDIIWYDNVTIENEMLTLPDPEIPRRPFLAIPLAELAPELTLADGGMIRDIAAAWGTAGMEPLPAFTTSLRKDLRHEHETR